MHLIEPEIIGAAVIAFFEKGRTPRRLIHRPAETIAQLDSRIHRRFTRKMRGKLPGRHDGDLQLIVLGERNADSVFEYIVEFDDVPISAARTLVQLRAVRQLDKVRTCAALAARFWLLTASENRQVARRGKLIFHSFRLSLPCYANLPRNVTGSSRQFRSTAPTRSNMCGVLRNPNTR